MPAQRVSFTEKELDLLLELASLATTGPYDEGDYQGWDEEGKYKTLESLEAKAAALLQRKKKKNKGS